ncbi:MAG: hypothetical protein Q4D05_00925 [Acinetobacter sp.]|nr:hypothetical protein [Acinetobacter sp.]
MKKLSLLLGSMAIAATLSTPAVAKKLTAQEQLLVGTWQCKSEVNVPDVMQIRLASNETYAANGELTSQGKMTLSMLGDHVNYDITSKSTWQLQGDQLHFVIKEITHFETDVPELEEMFKLKEQILAEPPATVKILALDKHHLKILDEKIPETPYTIECTR